MLFSLFLIIIFLFLPNLFALKSMDRTWLGTPIEELNRMPQCAPPLCHLKAVPNHTVTVRVSQPVFFFLNVS